MPDADVMPRRATGHLSVDDPAQKLLKLCVRFARKASVEAERGALTATVTFPWGGRCGMRATQEGLEIECDADDAALRESTRQVIDQHVAVFSCGQAEPPQWRELSSATS